MYERPSVYTDGRPYIRTSVRILYTDGRPYIYIYIYICTAVRMYSYRKLCKTDTGLESYSDRYISKIE